MLFNSPVFLFVFLPLVLILHFLSPNKFKNLVLCLSSLFFYAWGEQLFVVLIIASAIIDYTCGLVIEKGYRGVGLISSIVFNISILLYFKYSGFIVSNSKGIFEMSTATYNYFLNILLPLGISFYTFQTMSYTIDVYNGKIKANKNIIDFVTYVTMFPQLIAGPIVRYADIESKLKSRTVNYSVFAEGVERFIIGLAKKMIIANNCAFLADGVFDLPIENSSALIAWLGAIAYSFQIYFDFSGYSDMAIGLGKMLGFNFPENFNYPYISKSIREFWRRWHITLSTWFKDYLYIPLGGSKLGAYKTYVNLVIVFFITGLWHGANWTFIIWGFFHGFLLIFERLGFEKVLKRISPILSTMYTLFFVVIAWVIFRSDTIIDAFQYVKTMFTISLDTNWGYLSFYFTKEVKMAMLVGLVISMPIYLKIKIIFNDKYSQHLAFFSIGQFFKISFLVVLFLVSCIYIATDSYNPFIYFRF